MDFKKLITSPFFIYSIIGLIGLYLFKSIGSGLGKILEDSPEDIADKKELKYAKSFLRDLLGLNWFTLVMIPKGQKDANFKLKAEQRNLFWKNDPQLMYDKAADLETAMGLNDDESKISAILKGFYSQYDIAYFSFLFETKYKIDLYQRIDNSFSNSELINLYKNLSKKTLV